MKTYMSVWDSLFKHVYSIYQASSSKATFCNVHGHYIRAQQWQPGCYEAWTRNYLIVSLVSLNYRQNCIVNLHPCITSLSPHVEVRALCWAMDSKQPNCNHKLEIIWSNHHNVAVGVDFFVVARLFSIIDLKLCFHGNYTHLIMWTKTYLRKTALDGSFTLWEGCFSLYC